MSLDVYLEGDEITERCMCPNCFDEHEHKYREDLYSANITHNLAHMAAEGGFYKSLWRPEEVGIEKAEQLIPILQKAVDDMRAEPERFKAHNVSNGWGLYRHFLPWVQAYLDACRLYPEAMIRISR